MRYFSILSVLLALNKLFVPAQCTQRIILLGNYGVPSFARKRVSNTLKNYVKVNPVSYILSTGANFKGGLAAGKENVLTETIQDLFSGDENELRIPLYNVLGSDDWAGNPEIFIKKSQADYTEAYNDKTKTPIFTMPNWWYHQTIRFSTSSGMPVLSAQHQQLSIGLFMIDSFVLSNTFMDGTITEQANADLDAFIELAPKIYDYIIFVGEKKLWGFNDGFGHSNSLAEKLQKIKADIYVSGGDNAMQGQWVDDIYNLQCNNFSGDLNVKTFTNSKSGVANERNFSSSTAGFCALEIDADGITVNFIEGENGQIINSTKIERKERLERDNFSPYSKFIQLPQVKYWPLPSAPMPFGDSDLDFVTVVGSVGMVLAAAIQVLAGIVIMSNVMKLKE